MDPEVDQPIERAIAIAPAAAIATASSTVTTCTAAGRVRVVVHTMGGKDSADGSFLQPLPQPHDRWLQGPIFEHEPQGRAWPELAYHVKEPQRSLDCRRRRFLREHVLARAQSGFDRSGHELDREHEKHHVDGGIGKKGFHLGVPCDRALKDLEGSACLLAMKELLADEFALAYQR